MSDITHKPESQTLSQCTKIQSGIFKKMDENHKEIMTEVGGIKVDIAFMKGEKQQADKTATVPSAPIVTNAVSKHENGKINWKEVIIQAMIAWAPGLGILLVLGMIAILKSKGWL